MIQRVRVLSHLVRQSEDLTEDTRPKESVQNRCNDLELAQRVATNSPGAIEELIELHGDHLKRLIGNLSGSSSSQDDLLQETLLKAWMSANSYRDEAPLRHWLTKIAVRVCRNHHRGYRRLLTHLKSLWEHRSEQLREASAGVSPHEDSMNQAMTKLSYSDRELLVLYYLEEQTMSALSVQLGVKESTLHVRLHRSRERLKSLLENSEELP